MKRHSRIIVHCGSSKNGSTAIQSSLSRDLGALHSEGVGAVSVLTPADHDPNEPLSIEKYEIVSGVLPKRGDGTQDTTWLGAIYELYKSLREARNVHGLKELECYICESLRQAVRKYDTIILSAEAFETSLCLCDLFFKRLLKKLSNHSEILLIYYVPDPARHAIGAWLEWGWIEQYDYASWLGLYLKEVTSKKFYERRRQSYFGNLVRTNKWTPFWMGLPNISLNLFSNVRDVKEHFYKTFLPPISDSAALSSRQANIGWPRSYLRSFPLFFNFFAGDLDKYWVVRQAMVDKASSDGWRDESFFNELLSLTRSALAASGVGADGCRSQKNIDDIFANVSHLFRELTTDEVSRCYTYLADILYFHHVERHHPSLGAA